MVEPQTAYFGEEQYPGLFRKAALYWHRITTAHCFSDGNKRAGMISTDLFLRYNGYKIKVDQETLYVYCLLIGNHKTRPSLDEVEEKHNKSRPFVEKNIKITVKSHICLWDLIFC